MEKLWCGTLDCSRVTRSRSRATSRRKANASELGYRLALAILTRVVAAALIAQEPFLIQPSELYQPRSRSNLGLVDLPRIRFCRVRAFAQCGRGSAVLRAR